MAPYPYIDAILTLTFIKPLLSRFYKHSHFLFQGKLKISKINAVSMKQHVHKYGLNDLSLPYYVN